MTDLIPRCLVLRDARGLPADLVAQLCLAGDARLIAHLEQATDEQLKDLAAVWAAAINLLPSSA